MLLRKYILLLTLLFTSPCNTPNESGDEQQQDDPTSRVPFAINTVQETSDQERRKKRCPGCKTDLSIHQFGIPNRNCQGPGQHDDDGNSHEDGAQAQATPTLVSQPPETSSNFFDLAEAHTTQLREQLEALKVQEQQEKIRMEQQTLLREITARQSNIKRLRENNILPQPPSLTDFSPAQHPVASAIPRINSGGSKTNHVGPSIPPPSLVDFTTANHPLPTISSSNISGGDHNPIGLDSLITAIGNTSRPQQQTSNTFPLGFGGTTSLADMFRQQEQRSAELFLRPTKCSDTGQGKPLRIVDFVSRLRPTEEEKVITTDSGTQTKLLLSIGHKKPSLENITIEQYSIANLRIFYELLTSGKLPSAADVRDYLSFSIKIFELARKYTWESVLQYDDEYRILQHTYGYPWSSDNSHIHEVMLIPRWSSHISTGSTNKSPSKARSTSSSSYGTHNASGVEICRNFNRPSGCQKTDCKYAHCCNRKVGQKACGKVDHSGPYHHLALAPSAGGHQ